ncbi:hypothetical protein JOB18_035337 [Solea senegalensis]|uniref:G protein-regulated inducer of neurite outgrowth C-terminal domain-containing protein n=1 Tax=Solea senegalensis TaxID=28829 RepID=A0AAV6SNJ9_SOLSE|nr:G protein-regulated inducer of neurite outgrowth 1 [Solea senegalensis]KAG7518477.1 hypothetical protein JOB18_035337 [Solea senegalensis]
MGSLKNEMSGLREDQQTKTDDGEHPGGSNDSAAPEGPQTNTCQESTIQDDHQPKLQMNASHTEEGGKSPTSKDQVLPGEASDNPDSIQVKDLTQTETQQPEATHNNMAISKKFLNNGGGCAEIQDKEKDKEMESVLVPVSTTADPSNPLSPDPRSPAPFGQHHMRTQVSLEVVQCRSAATSPMTPPEGGHSFFFPSSFGGSGSSKDAELQVGQQVEFCSVATSPMTPKTPSTTAFPVLVGRDMLQRQGQVKGCEERRESGQQETRRQTEAESEKTGDMKCTTSKELTEGSSSGAAGLTESQVTQQCQQQRMGSMDQDITILVTHYGNSDEGGEEKSELSLYSIEPEMVKIDEYEEPSENKTDEMRWDGKTKISTETVHLDQAQDTNPLQKETSERPITKIQSDNSKGRENRLVTEESNNISITKHSVPESPAPFGCHNMRTQVSLEVVQCQSAATSPMTPPEGDHAFYFPSSFGKCDAVGAQTKDAELQVGQQVEFRSVATAPMTPRTPLTTTFPEIRKEASIEEKIVEEKAETEQGKKHKEDGVEEEKKKKGEASKENKIETINCKEKGEEKGEEPVQEVSWDDKGMTWEVYGAVVEVSVLGTAIQKHLEKQVKKQKIQPSLPPPPPLNPLATPLTSEVTQGCSGSGKGRAGKRSERDGKVSRRRRNPFRLLMENVQQPHCCSKAHTTE